MAQGKGQSSAGLDHKISAIDQELASLELGLKDEEDRWQSDPVSGALSAFKRTLILERALELASPRLFAKRTSFCFELVKTMKKNGNLPQKASGRGTSKGTTLDWDATTFGNYLRGQNIKPEKEEMENIAQAAAEIASRELASQGREGANIHHLLQREFESPSECLEKILANLAPASDKFWAERPFVSVLGPGFETEPRAGWPAPLEKIADDIHDELVKENGSGLILVTGPHLAGKKTALRYLCKRYRNTYLKLGARTRIPVLALALDELAPSEFVDRIFNFYRKANPSGLLTASVDESLTIAAKIEQVQRLSRVLPACIILADVTPIESDELVRSLHHDHVADIVCHLLEGDSRTKVVLTAGQADDQFGRIREEAERQGTRTRVFRLPEHLFVDRELRVLGEAIPNVQTPPNAFKISGITFQLAHIAKKLSKPKSGLTLRFERCLENNSDRNILDLIWEDLLDPHERFLLGAVSSSFDGLRVSVVARMASVLSKRNFPDLEPLSRAEHVLGLTSRLAGFVQVGRRPLDLGQRGWRRPSHEDLLFMDQGWRLRIMSIWMQRDAQLMRECLWLVAREAAEQARMFKTVGGLGNAKSALARDMQSFDALIASVDPKEYSEPPRSRDSWATESQVLPPLDRWEAEKPSALTVLRYAYQRWFSDYLEGEDYRLLTELDDPSLRLRLLLPFFDPSQPWRKLPDRELDFETKDEEAQKRSIEKYRQTIAAFPGKKLLPLLTGIALAARRVQRFDVLKSTVRMAEWILDTSSFEADPTSAFRILRAEIDAGLYGGGNPDVSLPMTPWDALPRKEGPEGRRADQSGQHFHEVIDRINRVLAERFPPGINDSAELILARAKLNSRLGEACHMAGKMGVAKRNFDKVFQAEDELVRLRGDSSSIGKILGGRSARACIAFLVDCSRRKQWMVERPTQTLKNGLVLPLPLIARENDEYLEKADSLLELNRRRIGAFDAADRLGVRMDQALLAAARGRYQIAMEFLRPAESARLRPGANAELSMEFCTLHIRTHLEAALLTVRFEAGGETDVDLPRYASDVRDDDEGGSRPLVDELLRRADRSLVSFRWLVNSRRATLLPCGMVFNYFGIWFRVLELRNSTPAEVRESLPSLIEETGIVMEHMTDAHFRRYLIEADLLRKYLQDSLARIDRELSPRAA